MPDWDGIIDLLGASKDSPSEISEEVRAYAAAEEKSFEIDRARLKLRQLELEVHNLEADLENKKQNKNLRLRFATGSIVLTAMCIAGVFGVVICSGACDKFEVSDTVLIALMSSVVVETIGILAIVARYLFPTNSAPKA